jgi:ATP-dependent helicase/nuclease subunit A
LGSTTVYRASAGSGKTHRLTGDYLEMAFASDFRKILAVTFTNKATAEMKGRILEELYKLSQGKDSAFGQIAGATGTAAKINAANLLENILQKYAWFSVSTIDSFLSGIFRSFLLEIGVSSVYDIELNQDAVLEKITDRLFGNVEHNSDLQHWLSRFARERIESGKKWEMKREITELGKELFRESFKLIDEGTKQKYADREFLNAYRKQLFAIQKTYENTLKEAGKKAMDAIQARGLSAGDFKQGSRGIYGLFRGWSLGQVKEPNVYVLNCLDDPEEWPGKGEISLEAAALRDELLMKLLTDTLGYMEVHRALYNTCEVVLRHFHTMGILGDLLKNLQQLSREENKILLSEAAALLRDIVGENDASFVFEKAGNLYLNFMVDEFQDTSQIQWQTLMPLVKNGLSENGSCMLVGDVKQSIYRFRNGDWELLASGAVEDLHPFPHHTEDLSTNWRSAPQVIHFNNSLFDMAPALLQQEYNALLAGSQAAVGDIPADQVLSLYEANTQEVSPKRKEAMGFVKLYSLKKEKDKTPPKDIILENLPAEIASLLAKGFRLRDIAILVRKKADGDLVTRVLREQSGREFEGKSRRFDFISDENLYLDESPAVYLLLSALRYLAFPNDAINLTALVHAWHREKGTVLSNDELLRAGASEDLLSRLPEEFAGHLSRIRQLAPVSMAEEIIRIFGLDARPEASPYLMAFMDQLLQFGSTERGGPAAFLEWWEEHKDTSSLTVNETQDAIRVMTIHKSKGLQFRVVILPFCDWEFDHDTRKTNMIWCKTPGPPFDLLEKVPVKYAKKLSDTLFAPDYFREMQKAYVDNLNLLYVALTRAEQGLIVFAPYETRKEPGIKTCSDLLSHFAQDYLANHSVEDLAVTENPFENEGLLVEWGKVTADWDTGSAAEEEITSLKLSDYPYHPFTERLAITYQGEGFFEEGKPAEQQGPVRGRVMHELFSLIRTKKDIERSTASLIAQGKLPAAGREATIAFVKEKLEDPLAGSWFEEGWQVYSEADILIPGKGTKRPDRVMVKGNEAVVVDYKFGGAEDRKYDRQVAEYCALMQEMGYRQVQGYIWYVELGKINRVV